MVSQRKMIRGILLFALFGFSSANSSFAQLAFEEVSESVGIAYSGRSFGASWGDFNGDGRPDLWVGSHDEDPRLYINTVEGQFELVPGMGAYRGDNHGAAWADFDNDGDQDLLILNGSMWPGSNNLLVNTAGQFIDKAGEFGLGYSLGRGRTPLWFDWNDDGALDVFLSNAVRSDGGAPSALFTRAGDSFIAENSLAGISTVSNNSFAQLGWSHAIDRPLLMVHRLQYPEALLRYDVVPFQPVVEQSGFPTSWTAHDVAFRDFDGDGQEDFFVVRAHQGKGSELASGQLRGLLEAGGGEVGVQFEGGGNQIQFSFGPSWRARKENIFVGSAGVHPDGATFSLSADESEHQGIAPHDVLSSQGIYVGYDSSVTRWKILASRTTWFSINYSAVGEQPITSATDINMETSDGAESDWLLLNIDGQLIDATASANLGMPTACESVAAADFDNDMDIDLYLVCRGIVGNRPNRMLVNNGDGTFTDIEGAAGADGSTLGMGESGAVADYDQDGFIDIFVTNGLGDLPFGSGPDQLFRNQGNSNKWLELDLVGVESNRDGIGARVQVLAGGVRQTRLVDGGMHRFSQDHARLHFGLANHQIIDEIVVNWPSGSQQVLTNVAPNQILEVVEPENNESDSDDDGFPDILDNCPLVANDQQDDDDDGIGNACDLLVLTTSLPVARIATQYYYTLTASHGQRPYTWTVTDGVLPSGLELDFDGIISGDVTAGGNTATFTVQVTDSTGDTATREMQITVKDDRQRCYSCHMVSGY